MNLSRERIEERIENLINAGNIEIISKNPIDYY